MVTILLSLVPRTLELASRRFAFDDQQWAAIVVLDQNVCTTAACATSQLPLGLQFDVLRFVALLQQTVDAFEHNKIFVGFEVAGLALIDDQARGFGISDLLCLEVHFQNRSADRLTVNHPLFLETEGVQQIGQIILSEHLVLFLFYFLATPSIIGRGRTVTNNLVCPISAPTDPPWTL